MDNKVAYAYGVVAGLKIAWKIFRRIDRETPMKMPLLLTALLADAKGKAEDYIYEQGGKCDGENDFLRD